MIGAEAGIGLFERPTVMSHPSYAGWFSFLLLFAPRLSEPVNLLLGSESPGGLVFSARLAVSVPAFCVVAAARSMPNCHEPSFLRGMVLFFAAIRAAPLGTGELASRK